MRLRNSALVLSFVRKHPNMLLVTVVAPGFCTPLIVIHICVASNTTATPLGLMASCTATAICFVKRSCTCNLRENVSAIRASLESPRT